MRVNKNSMSRNKNLPTVVLGAVLVLTGCTPAPVEDNRHERTAAFLDVAYTAVSGETISAALRKEGLYEDIATDLIDGCGNTGMPYAYASQIPDMEDTIIQAYDIACPD